MRQTYSKLISQCQSYCLNDTSDQTLDFIKKELNNSVRFIRPKLENYTVERTQTTNIVPLQQAYHLPVDCYNIVSIVAEDDNGMRYPLKPIDSQDVWDVFNAVKVNVVTYPKFYIVKKRSYEIYPILDLTWKLFVTYNYRAVDMKNLDYTTGTVTVTNTSQTITHSSNGFTKSMVGQWFQLDSDGYWYKISSYVSSSILTLETAYAGSTDSGTFIIGDSPDIPEESHELLAYRVASLYFGSQREDHTKAVGWDNMFWTGDWHNNKRTEEGVSDGLINLIAEYSNREESGIIEQVSTLGITPEDLIWGTKVTP